MLITKIGINMCYEFSLFSKKLKYDYSDYNKVIDLLHKHKIMGSISFIFYNSPSHLKGKFTYISINYKAKFD